MHNHFLFNLAHLIINLIRKAKQNRDQNAFSLSLQPSFPYELLSNKISIYNNLTYLHHITSCRSSSVFYFSSSCEEPRIAKCFLNLFTYLLLAIAIDYFFVLFLQGLDTITQYLIHLNTNFSFPKLVDSIIMLSRTLLNQI